MDLKLVRKELSETIELARAADRAIQIDFWRSLAIYQNGFVRPEAMNKLFKTDREHARIKFTAFGEAAAEALGLLGLAVFRRRKGGRIRYHAHADNYAS